MFPRLRARSASSWRRRGSAGDSPVHRLVRVAPQAKAAAAACRPGRPLVTILVENGLSVRLAATIVPSLHDPSPLIEGDYMSAADSSTLNSSFGIEPGRWQVNPAEGHLEFVVKTMWGLASVKGKFARYDGSMEVTEN